MSKTLPHAGELRTPIVAFRAKRTPAAGVGFTLQLTKFANFWAKYNEGTIQWLAGVQCEPFSGAYFVVRNNDELRLAINDVITVGTRCFRVAATRILDPELRLWMKVTCREDVSLKSEDFLDPDKVTVVMTAPVSEPVDRSTHNTYW